MLKPMPASFDYRPPLEPHLTIIYEDADLVVLDKPSGLLSVPGNHPHLQDSLKTRVQQRFPEAEMVHRLDMDTSGILVMARNKPALARTGMQFEKRTTEKQYIARVWGNFLNDSGLVDLPLATDWENKPRQRVDYERGRASQTEWLVLEREAAATRVALKPLTGRTHQLRVHMMEIGHVILGDVFYAEGEPLAAAPRLQLHAERLSFLHPTTGEVLDFHIPAPF
ncbi:MAG: RluA family pseudouridine synthase [Devosia sp.]|nr:RluA family pseudouridine synthase [Devosia sp.]